MEKLFVRTGNEEVEKEAKVMKVKLLKKVEPRIEVKTKEDEDKVINLSKKSERVFITCPDWKIIPLENLIAKARGKTKIIAEVRNAEEAKIAMETLEIGVDGLLLKTDNVKEFKKTFDLLQDMTKEKKIELVEAKITNIKQLGLGARACLDTCSIMKRGEGMLVGISSQGMLLVQAEVEKNPLAIPG